MKLATSLSFPPRRSVRDLIDGTSIGTVDLVSEVGFVNQGCADLLLDSLVTVVQTNCDAVYQRDWVAIFAYFVRGFAFERGTLICCCVGCSIRR
jgi:hypothetical protein